MGPIFNRYFSKVELSLNSLGFGANCHSWKWDLPHRGRLVIKRNYDWVVLPFDPNVHRQSDAGIN